MWQSITELPNLVRSYHSGYSQLTNLFEPDEVEFNTNVRRHSIKIHEWKLRHSILLLLTSWILSAALLSYLESPFEVHERAELERSLMKQRAKVLEALSWISIHLKTDSPEWSNTVTYLLDWHSQHLKSEHFKPRNSIEFVTTLMTANADYSRIDYPLSTISRIFLILWTPFAIVLYYLCVWKISGVVFKIKLRWAASFACCLLLFGMFSGVIQLMHDWRMLIGTVYKWTMFIANIRSVDTNIHWSIQLAVHFIAWAVIFTLYRYLKLLQIHYFNKLVYFGMTLFYYNNSTFDDFQTKKIEFILEEFRQRSLWNRIYLLLFFNYKQDVQRLRNDICANVV